MLGVYMDAFVIEPDGRLALSPGAVLGLTRTGRLYGAPSRWAVGYDGRNLRAGPIDEVFPPSGLDERLDMAELV